MEVMEEETKREPSIGFGREESVSFGRFKGDSLSWDRWSSFSQNKYMEEAEKYSTPGSVAMKKAYFEAHFRKIAAQMAELVEQENQIQANPLTPNGSKYGGADDDKCVRDPHSAVSEEVEPEMIRGCLDPWSISVGAKCSSDHDQKHRDFDSSVLDGNEAVSDIMPSGTPKLREPVIHMVVEGLDYRMESPKFNESGIRADIPVEKKTVIHALDEGHKMLDGVDLNELDNKPSNLVVEKSEEYVSIEELDYKLGSVRLSGWEAEQDIPVIRESEVNLLVKQQRHSSKSSVQVEAPSQFKQLKNKTHSQKQEDASVMPQGKESQKKTSNSMENNAQTKTKQAFAMLKSPSIPNSRTSRPKSASSPGGDSNSITRNKNSALGGNKKTSVAESKRHGPSSMQIPLTSDSTAANSATPSARRRTSIMEQMGDKDIIKRAFKTFRSSISSLNLSTNVKASSVLHQVSTEGAQRNLPATSSLIEDKDREKKVAGKADVHTGQVIDVRKSVSDSTRKTDNGIKARVMSQYSPSRKADEKVEKNRKIKLEKSSAKEVKQGSLPLVEGRRSGSRNLLEPRRPQDTFVPQKVEEGRRSGSRN